MKETVKFKKYRKEVYRNTRSREEHIELSDDLDLGDLGEKGHDILKEYNYPDSFAPETMDRLERIFNRTHLDIINTEVINPKYKPGKWRETRFSNGSWKVIYSAESEETALTEGLYHDVRGFYKEELELYGNLEVHRRCYVLFLNTDKCVDFTNRKKDFKKLKSKDQSGYPFCQKLAERYIKEGAFIFRTPSARQKGGVCVPIFNLDVIDRDKGIVRTVICNLTPTSAKIFKEDKIIDLS